jgi:hypothetical protein
MAYVSKWVLWLMAAMVRCLLEGATLSKFNELALVHKPETMAHYEDIMRDLDYYVFPNQALQVQKGYMRHYMQKL